jgi:hypothetical protein
MIVVTFKDPQNAIHTDAVMCVISANENTNKTENYSLSKSDYMTVINPLPQTRSFLNYRACYWINEDAKESGAQPYVMVSDMGMGEDFNFENDVSYDGLTLVEKCEKHLLDVILLPMMTF